MVQYLNKIICGDCLEVMKELPDKCIDMILCDLPYGTTACSWDTIIPFEPLWEQYKRIAKNNAAIVLTASQPFTSKLIMSNLKMFRYCWVWKKSQAVGHLNAYKMPMKQHEDIVVFYGRLPIYNPQYRKKELKNIRLRPETRIRKSSSCYGKHDEISKRKIPIDVTLPRSIIEFNNSQNNNHPTEKPIPLFEYLIKTYTNPDEIVLDNCIGSGTTAIAAKQTDRKFIGIDISPEYCDIAKKRLENTLRRKGEKTDK
jgi:site-specific DNA-methyltransferase (adenine-specific)